MLNKRMIGVKKSSSIDPLTGCIQIKITQRNGSSGKICHQGGVLVNKFSLGNNIQMFLGDFFMIRIRFRQCNGCVTVKKNLGQSAPISKQVIDLLRFYRFE